MTENLAYFTKWFDSIDWDAVFAKVIAVGLEILILVILYFILKFAGSKMIKSFFQKNTDLIRPFLQVELVHLKV